MEGLHRGPSASNGSDLRPRRPSYPSAAAGGARARGRTVLTHDITNRLLVLAVSAGVVLVIVLGGAGAAGAQIIPTTTTTQPPPESTTTTTTIVPEATTTTAVEPTTTAPAPTATTGAPRASTTTTEAGSTTTTFVPPTGVPGTTEAPPAEEVLDADLGKLPLFVALSLLGFFVAIAIVAVQWVRTRP